MAYEITGVGVVAGAAFGGLIGLGIGSYEAPQDTLKMEPSEVLAINDANYQAQSNLEAARANGESIFVDLGRNCVTLIEDHVQKEPDERLVKVYGDGRNACGSSLEEVQLAISTYIDAQHDISLANERAEQAAAELKEITHPESPEQKDKLPYILVGAIIGAGTLGFAGMTVDQIFGD